MHHFNKMASELSQDVVILAISCDLPFALHRYCAAGHVIATSINRLTNTVNSTLRKAAEDAAKKARFNAVDGVNNQTGTITYYFNLK